MAIQNREAHEAHFTYLRTPAQIRRFVKLGLLVRIRGDADFYLHNVHYPYARPEVKVFLHRLAREYHGACGERLVVTSLVRPLSYQRELRYGSDESVHPTGMAIDMRRSESRRCRSWLERTLLQLEGDHVLEATREHHPPHYHVALFPSPYKGYVAMLTREQRARTALALRKESGSATGVADSGNGASVMTHKVKAGDSLWGIAREYDSSVDAIVAANRLDDWTIMPGQLLKVPPTGSASSATTTTATEDVAANTYRVGPGDTLWAIAREYGTSVKALKQVNDLRSASIRPGQTLTIPTSAHSESANTGMP